MLGSVHCLKVETFVQMDGMAQVVGMRDDDGLPCLHRRQLLHVVVLAFAGIAKVIFQLHIGYFLAEVEVHVCHLGPALFLRLCGGYHLG